jgi:hypothetical protein
MVRLAEGGDEVLAPVPAHELEQGLARDDGEGPVVDVGDVFHVPGPWQGVSRVSQIGPVPTTSAPLSWSGIKEQRSEFVAKVGQGITDRQGQAATEGAEGTQLQGFEQVREEPGVDPGALVDGTLD